MIYYLATPYTSDKLSKMRHRYVYALVVSEELRKQGYVIYSPIIHWHMQTHLFDLHPDASFWESYNKEMMDVCGGIIIPQVPQWELSEGLADEISIFQDAGKIIKFYNPKVKFTPDISKTAVPYDDILEAVSEVAGISTELIMSPSKLRKIADIRHLARYLFMILNSHISYQDAGLIMGADHSTIHNSLEFCNDRLKSIAKDNWFISIKDNVLNLLATQKRNDIKTISSTI